MRAAGASHNNLAAVYLDMGRPHDAAEEAKLALRIGIETGDLQSEHVAQIAIAYANLSMEPARFPEASAALTLAQANADLLGDRRLQASAAGAWGAYEAARGGWEAAAQHFANAAAGSQRANDTTSIGLWLTRQACAFHRMGRIGYAAETYARGIPMLESANAASFLPAALGNFGLLRHGEGKFEEAAAFYRRALDPRLRASMRVIGPLYARNLALAEAEQPPQGEPEID
jgi:tetratricopeptide (TPR) repeat protein